MRTKMLAEANVVHITLVHNVGTTTRITEVMVADSELTAKVWVQCNSKTWTRDPTTVPAKSTRTLPLGDKKKMRWSWSLKKKQSKTKKIPRRAKITHRLCVFGLIKSLRTTTKRSPANSANWCSVTERQKMRKASISRLRSSSSTKISSKLSSKPFSERPRLNMPTPDSTPTSAVKLCV